ncbi:MAG: RsmB/NOP family class I SAM-dependent RNA methyltransferase [Pirellulaceae bacterium]
MRNRDAADDSNLTQLPPEFVERMKLVVAPDQLDAFLVSFEQSRRPAVRFNPLGQQPLPDIPSRVPVSWSDHSFAISQEDRDQLVGLPQAEQGSFYLQSLSSQLAAIILDPQPGEQVLDLAAAPGGKAAHLAALMNNDGLLSCVEPIRKRFFRLQANLKAQGVTIAKYYMTDGRTVGKKVGPRFDRVMLDAPCSGEARFSLADPESFTTWRPRKIRETSRKQIGLIQSAFESLRPGGRMLYSTCSFAPEENEGVVSRLLEVTEDAATILPIRIDGKSLAEHQVPAVSGLTQFDDREFHPTVAQTQRIMPSDLYDGFYLALIKKQA